MAGARYACVALVLAVAAALPDELKSASSTVYLVGSMPQGLRTDWLGAYDQLGKTKRWRSGLCDGRIIYAKQNDKSKMIWYHKKSAYWYVGRTRAAGKAAGVLSVKDHALMPEKISGHWKAWWGPKKSWIDAPELQCVGGNRGRKIFEAATLAVAGADKTVHLIGTTPLGQRHEWLGAYVQREGDLVGGRHAYTKQGDPAKMLWYNAGAGTWYMGGKAALGQRKGILKAHDSAAAPELIKPGMWQLGQGEGKGWLSAPDMHCLHGSEADKALKSEQNALLVAQRTVYLFDAHASLSPGTSGSTAPAWQGAYTIEATEEGRHRYVKPGDSVGIKSAWVLSYSARAGTWLVSRKGKRRTALKTWLSVYDAAQIPDKIQGSWRAWKDGGWAPSSVRVVAGVEGEAMMRQQAVEEARELSRSATTVLLSGTTPGGWGHEWFGAYTQRTGSLVDGRFVFAHEVDDSKALWFDGRSGRWCVGTHEAYEERFHPNKAILSVVDAALAPERISAQWMLRTDAQTEAWVPASSVRAVASDGREGEALRRARLREQNSAASAVYLVGETPASFPSEWMGAYELSRSDAKPNERHVYRRQGDAGKELRYHPKTGDWRVHQAGGGETTTVLSVYDGAELPEQISTAWRAYSKEQGWQDAPEVRCKSGLDGKVALEADHAAAAVVTALTPGWLFPVRADSVIEKLKAALAAGARPARLHAMLSRARPSDVDPSIIDAAAAQLGPAARRAPLRLKAPSMPTGLAWRKLARQMNGTYAPRS